MPVRMRKSSNAGVERGDVVELALEALAVEAVGDRQARRVVGEHHVLVAERLRRGRHLLDLGAAVAPRRVQVAVAAQSVAVALAGRRDRHLGRRLEVGEVVRHLAGQRLGDHLGGGVTDAVELGQRAGGGPLGDLGRVGVAHDVARPLERLGLEPGVVGPVEAVHDPVERGLRRHRRQGTGGRQSLSRP